MIDAYGSDIGNAYAFLSVVTQEELDALPMIPVQIDRLGMPTIAYVTPPEGSPIYVNFAANCDFRTRSRIKHDPGHIVRAIKTQLHGNKLPLKALNTELSPYRVYAEVAKELVRVGNECRKEEGLPPIYRLVLTYPAAFSKYPDELQLLNRMQQAVESVKLDGHHLEVVGRLPEPAAVAIDYLYRVRSVPVQNDQLPQDSLTVLVYDLGHGTFDVAAVTARSKGEPYQVWDSDGLPDVGGKDFDSLLVQELLSQMEKLGYRPSNDDEREELLGEAIRAKHELSDEDEVSVQHQKRTDGSYLELTITRERFEEITRQLLMETVELTQQMLTAQLQQGRQIDRIVLSGGASQMPMVLEALKTSLNPKVEVLPPYRPARAVSFGAARYAAGLPEPEDSDGRKDPGPARPSRVAQLRAKRGYGVEVLQEGELESRVQVLIKAGEPLPAIGRIENYRPSAGVAGHIDCVIDCPDVSAEAGDLLFKSVCHNFILLHFDLPQQGTYDLDFTLDPNYNITVTLTDSDGVAHTAGTAAPAGEGGTDE